MEEIMAAEIGILVMHGIGIQNKNFADGLIDEMNGRLQDLGILPGTFAWKSAFWADLLTPNEEELWKKMSTGYDLDWVTVRKFIINVLADALAYQRDPGEEEDMYRRIHTRFRQDLADLRNSLGGQDKPLIILAHSLGSVIVSNYIWDEQRKNKYCIGRDPFERMETLASLVTFGSNIPLFTLALPDPKSIDFPPAQLPANLKKVAKWLNFFDPDDVLGYPLKPLSQSYGNTVSKDVEINSGSLFASWNPISHTEYWTDDDFTKPVAELIRDVDLARKFK